MTHVIDLMSTRTSADFCVEGKKIKRSCHHSGPHRLPLGAGLWPAGRGLHMPGVWHFIWGYAPFKTKHLSWYLNWLLVWEGNTQYSNMRKICFNCCYGSSMGFLLGGPHPLIRKHPSRYLNRLLLEHAENLLQLLLWDIYRRYAPFNTEAPEPISQPVISLKTRMLVIGTCWKCDQQQANDSVNNGSAVWIKVFAISLLCLACVYPFKVTITALSGNW